MPDAGPHGVLGVRALGVEAVREYGERNEAAHCPAGLGWERPGVTIRELPAAHDLAPLKADEMRMGAMRYVGVSRTVPV